jgi:ACS family hexuronate transporter-like MFS transporter
MWIPLFRWLYRSPEEHPRLSPEERQDILANRGSSPAATTESYRTLLRLPHTWGIIIGKGLTDPVWFLITDWFAIYLATRGFPLEDSLLAFWVPFMAADVGNFAGGGVSSFLIKRGWKVGLARKTVIVLGTVGMLFLIPAIYTTSLQALAACFAVATFSYAAVSTMILNLPADVFPARSVGTVAGLGGTAAGICTIAATLLTGYISDRYSFEPLLIGASLIPIAGMAAVLVLVRNTDATRRGVVNEI